MERISNLLESKSEIAVDERLRVLFGNDSDFIVDLVDEDLMCRTYSVEHTSGFLYERCFIMIDAHTDVELADEEAFVGEPPLWFTEHDHRESPFFRMHEIAKKLDSENCRCFYVTRGSICNYDDMVEVWDEMRCGVWHDMQIDSLEIRPDEEPKPLSPFNPARIRHSCLSDEIYSTPADQAGKDVINIYLDEESGEYLVSSRDSAAMNASEFSDWLLSDLDKMAGLEAIKTAMRDFADFVIYDELAKNVNGGVSPHPEKISTSAVFVGNPGTGKTTVAKFYGKILYNVGLLKSAEVKVLSREDIINKPYYGMEEQNLKCIVGDMEENGGGVLFIDEAYSLCPEHDPKDPGHLVITNLMRIMDTHPDIALVLAGYPDEMERFLNGNQGLRSRLAGRIFRFDDYDVDTLIGIALSMLAAHNYDVTPAARSWLEQHIEDAYTDRDRHFGNGRFVEKLVERIFTIHARRIVHQGRYIPSEIMVIKAEDIPVYEPIRRNSNIGSH